MRCAVRLIAIVLFVQSMSVLFKAHMTDTDEENLHTNRIYASSHDASVPTILLHDPECALRLN